MAAKCPKLTYLKCDIDQYLSFADTLRGISDKRQTDILDWLEGSFSWIEQYPGRHPFTFLVWEDRIEIIARHKRKIVLRLIIGNYMLKKRHISYIKYSMKEKD